MPASTALTAIAIDGVDASAEPAAVAFASGCTQPCTSVDIYSTATVEVITFAVVTTITGGLVAQTSDVVTLTIVCDAASTAITPSFTTPVTDLAQGVVSPADRHNFGPFTCTVPACCVGPHVLTYTLSAVASGTPTPVTGMVDEVGYNSESSQYYVAPASTAAITSFEYYIYAENGWGTSVFSSKATINVNCISTSAVLGEGAFPSGFTDYQRTDVSDTDA